MARRLHSSVDVDTASRCPWGLISATVVELCPCHANVLLVAGSLNPKRTRFPVASWTILPLSRLPSHGDDEMIDI